MKHRLPTPAAQAEAQAKTFFDMIAPSAIRFFPDSYIFGSQYRCAWAVREYPPSVTEQALLAHFGDRRAVTVKLYSRLVDGAEQNRLVQNSSRRNRLVGGGDNVRDAVAAEANQQDLTELLGQLQRDREPLLHCAVFLELAAPDMKSLQELQTSVQLELTRCKITVDRLLLRQKEGFLAVMPTGWNTFGAQFERAMPASSVANLYPFSYSGKTDPHGFFLGRDKYGSNILADFDQRAGDKTNANALILGNSGEGKSHLMKLILTNLRESGKSVIILDAEDEYRDLTESLGGCTLDFLSGRYIINPLEPRAWADGPTPDEEPAPETFRRVTRLSQHISYLKDLFRASRDFTDAHIDTIELMLMKLYARFGIDDTTDFTRLASDDYPIPSDLYDLIEKEYHAFDREAKHIYTEEILREICLGLHSMCKGAESKYFNGHTNVTDSKFLCFGIKGILDTNRRLRDTLLFNILSYMSSALLTKGNTVASIDEVYLYLSNPTAVEYIRNCMKRVRKKGSAMILASQNLEDMNLPGVREYTRPLFSIPTHTFLFNGGNIEAKVYMECLQLEPSEFELIRYPCRGTCLYKCGNERYLLQVIAPEYKKALFGDAGGK